MKYTTDNYKYACTITAHMLRTNRNNNAKSKQNYKPMTGIPTKRGNEISIYCKS
jgi:hypothetical protein